MAFRTVRRDVWRAGSGLYLAYNENVIQGDIYTISSGSATNTAGSRVCITPGTGGTYNEAGAGALTCTTFGTTSVTLSGPTHATNGLIVGNKVLINGVTTYIATRPTLSTITVQNVIPASGPGTAIAYVAPVWQMLAYLPSIGSTHASGDITDNNAEARKGVLIIPAGSSTVKLTSSQIGTEKGIFTQLVTTDATLTSITYVDVSVGGEFTIHGNANATADTTVFYVIGSLL